jgi:hypothetical protein
MKKILPPVRVLLLSLSVAAIAFTVYYYNHQNTPRIEAEDASEASDDPIARTQYEFNMVKDPATGKIPEGIYDLEIAQAREIYARQLASKVQGVNTYTFQGPNNLGGRTRAVAYDIRFNGTSNQVILAGSVSGGLFKSTDNGATWTRKSPTNQLFSVTSIAQDTRVGQENTWYYATGEHLGNSAGDGGALYLGNGIYKSTDNGETWARLTNSNTSSLEGFNARQDLIAKVIVDPTNGNVYFTGMDGVYRSTDGGANWTLVMTSGSNQIATSWIGDIVCTSTGRLYATFSGFNRATGVGITNMPGVWTSTTGALGTWTKIAGDGAATNPAGWKADSTYGRIVLALAPSSQNILYAMYDNNLVFPNKEAHFFKWDQNTTTWVDRSANLPDEAGGDLSGNDPFACQGGYDLVITVKPDDPNVVFIGGTNAYRSTDAFASTANTKRIGGYADNLSYALYANSHPDIHALTFQQGSNSIMICGNDGGIQRTTDVNATTVAWTDVANAYRTYQYYYVALDPRANNGKVIGGAQDNGTTRNVGGTGTTFERVFSGDGVSVGLSTTHEFLGTQSGSIRRRLVGDALDVATSIRPNTASSSGLFVTLFRLDPDNTENLYYANNNSLYKTTAASTVTTTGWTQLNGVGTALTGRQITALATTRGTYNASTASLFIAATGGKLFRLDDPANATPGTSPVDITGAGFPTVAPSPVTSVYPSSVAVNPRNDDTVIVTFSNYGITSIFWTGNANSATPTWQNVEGNLTLPSYRSSAIAITNNGVEYFVGTSVGLYKATIDGANPGATTWTQEGATEIGNALVGTIALRPADNRLLIGTHGYGMWATTLTGAGLPVNITNFTGRVEDRQNMLLWKVENEVDSKGYEVERKYKNESGFTKIGFVAAKTNSTTNEYTFPDALVDLGIDNVSYRLKQIDVDGKFNYSTTVTLARKVSARFVEYISVRPNSMLIRMNGQSNNQQLINFRLFDNSGKLLQQKQLQLRTQEVSLTGLSRGVYVVDLSAPDGRRFTQKIAY